MLVSLVTWSIRHRSVQLSEVDIAFEKFDAVFREASAQIAAIHSEEDAKVHLINRILYEVLGWPHDAASYEAAVAEGFIDIKLSEGGRCYAVIEAKKIGVISIDTANTKKGTYKLSGPVLTKCRGAIEQCSKYFQSSGALLACVTDGVSWIFFKTYVEGRPYLDGNAIVFPSLEAIKADFSTFFELISRVGVGLSLYKVIFDEINSGISNTLLRSESVVYDHEYSVIKKDQIAYDIEQILKRYFSNLSGEDDPELIVDCFVETKESRIADFSLEKITRSIIGNILPHTADIPEELSAVIEDAVQYQRGETVFIVGPSGAGKSTFVSRFFKRMLPSALKDRCLILTLNAVDAQGDSTTFTNWMTERIISQIESQHFDSGAPSYDDLRGLYHHEYVKRSVGIDAPLYRSDKEAFKRKFSDLLDGYITNDRLGYLERLLADAIKSRKKLPVFIVDNTDEFQPEFREVVYQYFQSLKRSCSFALLIIPMTDQTAWTFMRSKIYNVYSSKSFFLPTPSPKEVLRKRIDYLKRRSAEKSGNHTPAEYFSTQGFKIKIQDIEGFSRAVEDIFINTDFLTSHVALLANYNIRETLDLSRRIITSSVFEIDEIIRSYVVGKRVVPNYRKFIRALIQGDYAYFKAVENKYIFPIFDISEKIRYSPLLSLRVLVLLRQARTENQNIDEKHWAVSDVVSYFDGMGIGEPATKHVLAKLLASDLVEPFDLSDREIHNQQRLAITSKGLAHIDLALFNDAFFAQMMFTARINDPEVVRSLRGVKSKEKLGKDAWHTMFKTFANYLLAEDARTSGVPAMARYEVQAKLSAEIEKRWTQPIVLKAATINENEQEATVEWFDRIKGWGFVRIEALRENAFLHISALEKLGLSTVSDGATMKVITGNSPRGLSVERIVSIADDLQVTKDRAIDGVIVRLVPDRGFGFVSSSALDEDAFFHFTLFDEKKKPQLREGLKLRFEVSAGREGRSFQVSKVLSIAN